jgi:uncharacterized protein YneR
MALTRITDVDERTHSYTFEGEDRYRFVAGEAKNAPRTSPWLSEEQYGQAKKLQSSTPVCVGHFLSGKSTWRKVPVGGKALWWYKDQFYVQGQEDSLGHERKDTAEGLTKLSGVNLHREQVPPGRDPEKGASWWSKITGATEDASEHSVARGEGRYFFTIGASQRNPPRTRSISQNEYDQAMKLQSSRPVAVGTIIAGKKTWYRIPLRGKVLWWYTDEFYLQEGHTVLLDMRDQGAAGLTKLPGVRGESTAASLSRPELAYRFALGQGFGAPETWPAMRKKEYTRAKKLQSSEPVCLGTIPHGKHRDKALWWYKDEFYLDKDGHTWDQVQLLLWESEQKSKRKFDRLRKEMLSDHAIQQARRERIPEDVRIFVWKRDDGRCVQCGSQENLEFDHVVPVSKGGSNTARNIQLLCEACNRRKSDSI